MINFGEVHREFGSIATCKCSIKRRKIKLLVANVTLFIGTCGCGNGLVAVHFGPKVSTFKMQLDIILV